MKPTGRAVLQALFACGLLSLANSTANAQAIRYISTTGNDANTCVLTAPCRNLQRGINATPAGGELRVLDSGGYGFQGVITKSMSIAGQGNTLLMGGSPNILVNAPGEVVMLRNLNLNGRGLIDDGIRVSSADAVHVVHCTVERFAQTGILMVGGNSEFHILDVVARSNGANGVVVDEGTGSTTVTVDRSIFENNGQDGFLTDADASITNTVASGNTGSGFSLQGGRMNAVWTTAANNGFGFYVTSDETSGGEMNLEFSTARGNPVGGLLVGNASVARISNSTITDNGTGIVIAIGEGGVVQSRDNNTVAGNGTDIDDPDGGFSTFPPM